MLISWDCWEIDRRDEGIKQMFVNVILGSFYTRICRATLQGTYLVELNTGFKFRGRSMYVVMTRWPRFLAPGLVTPTLRGYLSAKALYRQEETRMDMACILLFLLEVSFNLISSGRFQGLCAFLSILVDGSCYYFFSFLQSTLFGQPSCDESDVDLRNVSRVLPPSMQNAWRLRLARA